MTQNNKIITGIYLVEKKWDLIWLKNKVLNIEETLNYFKFETLLFQTFEKPYIIKILDAINCEKKLIIDFDKAIVKIVEEKPIDYYQEMTKYFNPTVVQDWLEGIDIDNEEELYKNYEIRNL